MTARAIVTEAFRTVKAHRMISILMAVVAAVMAAGVFLTAGKAVATEQSIMSSINDTAPRLITIATKDAHSALSEDFVTTLTSLNETEWVLALGPVEEVTNPAIPGSPSLGRQLLTDLPAEVVIERGRQPGPGEALLSAPAIQQLHLVSPAGQVVVNRKTPFSVVGSYQSSGALEHLTRLVLLGRNNNQWPGATLIYLVAKNAAVVPQLTAHIGDLLDPGHREEVSIYASEQLAAIHVAVSGELGGFSRILAIGMMAIGMLVIALATTITAIGRRKDYGRRRALGATRSVLTVLAVCEIEIPVIAGSILGSLAGLITVVMITHTALRVGFVLAVPILVINAGLVAAIPSAIWAAHRDPVSILRVP